MVGHSSTIGEVFIDGYMKINGGDTTVQTEIIHTSMLMLLMFITRVVHGTCTPLVINSSAFDIASLYLATIRHFLCPTEG